MIKRLGWNVVVEAAGARFAMWVGTKLGPVLVWLLSCTVILAEAGAKFSMWIKTKHGPVVLWLLSCRNPGSRFRVCEVDPA